MLQQWWIIVDIITADLTVNFVVSNRFYDIFIVFINPIHEWNIFDETIKILSSKKIHYAWNFFIRMCIPIKIVKPWRYQVCNNIVIKRVILTVTLDLSTR